MHLRQSLAVVAATLFAAPALLPAATLEEPVAGFEIGPSGPSRFPLTLHSDGNFYGTGGGGAFTTTSGNITTRNGTVFRLSPGGGLGWFSLTGVGHAMPGRLPDCSLVPGPGGWLWGTTQNGGVSSDQGSVFRMRPETGEHETMLDFINTNPFVGQSPSGGLTADGLGWLWGITFSGGNGGKGTIYKIHATTGVYAPVNSSLTFGNPNPLYFDGGSSLWGTTTLGGAGGGGTVFRMNRVTGAMTTVGQFSATGIGGNTLGFQPSGPLTPDGNGFLWGVTNTGGGSSKEVIFKVDLTGTTPAATTLVTQFTGTTAGTLGSNPRGGFAVDGDGFLWGATAAGGNANKGTIFKVDPSDGTFTTVVQFGTLTGGNVMAAGPWTPLTYDGNGYVWGIAWSDTAATWAFYKVEVATGILTKVTEFSTSGHTPHGTSPVGGLKGTAGSPWLYGTASQGGKFNFGTLYRYNTATGQHETLTNFSGTSGAAVGSSPETRLHVHTDGTLWGTTRAGGTTGSGFGTVFKYNPATLTFTNLLSFTATSGAPGSGNPGAAPKGRLATGSDGFIYGTTSAGNNGNLFKINPATSALTVVKSFQPNPDPLDGSQPLGGVTADANGVLWGMTTRGGGVQTTGNGYGTLFSYNPASSTFTTVVKFTGPAGAFPGSAPTGDVVIDAGGLIWGTTSSGTFKYNRTNQSLVYEANSALWPIELASAGSLYLHNDGEVYGVFSTGGRSPNGEPSGGGMIYRRLLNQPAASTPVFSPAGDDPHPSFVDLSVGIDLIGLPGSYQFEWGPTSKLGQVTPSVAVSSGGNPVNPPAVRLPPLVSYTTYYYRMRVDGPNGSVYGPMETVLTRQANPIVENLEIAIESPLGIPLLANPASVNVGDVIVGSARQQAVVIHNLGQFALGALTAEISGPDADRFEITTDLDTTTIVGFGATSNNLVPATSVTITYTPDDEGEDTATLTIGSNDADENPFIISLSGTGVVLPDITVEQPLGFGLASDGSNSVDFGASEVGLATDNLEFFIGNDSPGTLNNIVVTLIGDQAGDFEIVSLPDASVPASGTTSLIVGFTPTAHGPRSATLRITSNDPDESPFDIVLTGAGIGFPEIVVEQPVGTVIPPSGGSVPFGSVTMNTSLARTFTITNIGNAPLTGVSAAIIGQEQYAITTPPVATIAAGASATFVVTLTPLSPLPVIAVLRMTSNDPDETTFDITLNGSGQPLPNPVFTTQPASRVATIGDTVTFSPVLTGNDPKTYQWKKGTTNIAGVAGQGATYDIATVKASDVGLYSVVVSNNTPPPATSANAALGVVTRGPLAVSLNEHKILTLTCTATPPTSTGYAITYTWKRNQVALSTVEPRYIGENLSSLKINDIHADEGGDYTCSIAMTPTGGQPFFGNSGSTAVSVLTSPVLEEFNLPPYLVSQSVNIPLYTLGNMPAKFTATGLPAGVKLDPVTGVLSGKPTLAKSNQVKVTVTNTAGTFSVTKTWVINDFDPVAVGAFHGLVAREVITNFDMGGFVQITVAKTGAITGSVTLAGQKWPVTGVLNTGNGPNPTATLVAKRTPVALKDLTIDLTIGVATQRMSGFIRDAQFSAMASELALGNGAPAFANGGAGVARFNTPRGIAVAPAHVSYVADTGNHVIRKIASDRTVTTYAGSVGTSGLTNDTGEAAAFSSPEALVFDSFGNLLVADTGNHVIRKIAPGGVVTTLAGSGAVGSANGTGAAASFSAPCALALDPSGNLIVVDRGNHTLRKITPGGVVTTLAGKPGVAGHKDGGGTVALFNSPAGITYDPLQKTFFVTDPGNHVIRKVLATGTVSTYAGSPGVEGFASGLLANARFIAPQGITTNRNGTLFVADGRLMKITPGGIVAPVTEFVSPDNDQRDHPASLAYDFVDSAILAADETLHGVTTHEADGPHEPAAFSAERANASPAANLVGTYNVSLNGTQNGDAAYPQGGGYATLAITNKGVANWTGKTADGATFTFSTVLTPAAEVSLHAILYKNTGSLQTLAGIHSDGIRENSPPLGSNWYKLPQPLASTDRTYKAGFPVHDIQLKGGKYTPPNHLFNFLHLVPGASNALLNLDYLTEVTIAHSFTIASPSVVTVPPGSILAKLTFTPATGLFTGSFNIGNPARKATIAGLLINDDFSLVHAGGGHFIFPATTSATSPMLSGKVYIHSSAP